MRQTVAKCWFDCGRKHTHEYISTIYHIIVFPTIRMRNTHGNYQILLFVKVLDRLHCFLITGFQWLHDMRYNLSNILERTIFGNYHVHRIVKYGLLSICYNYVFMRVCIRQQSNQSSATVCLTFLCPGYINRILARLTAFAAPHSQIEVICIYIIGLRLGT